MLWMNMWPVIKAPVAVQLNRIAFAIYTAVFGSYLWRVHRIASVEGTAIFLGMIFLSVLGLFYSCVRARRSRWIMAVLVVLIPGLVFTSTCLLAFTRPEGWTDWLVAVLTALLYWFATPILLALSLFKNFYITFRKLDMVVEFRPARKSNEYFT
jgi:peptidoglycan/LPS O-acetylase OafA/YrhL